MADAYPCRVILEFSGDVWHWKGPAPFHFVTVPDEECRHLPVTAHIGRTAWTTSLFPKDGRYIVPLKAAVRRAEALELGDTVNVRLTVGF